jgi:hypothetical protein
MPPLRASQSAVELRHADITQVSKPQPLRDLSVTVVAGQIQDLEVGEGLREHVWNAGQQRNFRTLHGKHDCG